MIIAKIIDDSIKIGYHKDLFPNTSFPDSGPNDDWFTENSCMKVSTFVNHDSATQQLKSCEPYIVDGIVYTNKAVPKQEVIITEPEITIEPQGTATPI